jgi:hypothetical protein
LTLIEGRAAELDNLERGLCDDLDQAGRRRLWIVQIVMERLLEGNPARALELAFRFEQFIQRGGPDATARPEPQPAREPALAPPAVMPADVRAKERPAADPARTARLRGPLLESETREAFAAIAATGVDNRELARRFQLTVRQAHAIRLSMARQRPEVRPQGKAGARSSAVADIQRQGEAGRVPEESSLLQRGGQGAATIEDVLHFLRQRGDHVVKCEGHFLVNGRLQLNADQLIARANQQRHRMGVMPFDVDSSRGLLAAG